MLIHNRVGKAVTNLENRRKAKPERKPERSPGNEAVRKVGRQGCDLIGMDDGVGEAADVSGEVVQVAGRTATDKREQQFAFGSGIRAGGDVELAIAAGSTSPPE